MAAASFKHIGSLAFIFVIIVLFLLLLEGVLPITERKQLIAGVGSDGSDERGEGVAVPDGRVSLHVQNTRTLPLLPQVHSQYAGQPERGRKRLMVSRTMACLLGSDTHSIYAPC